MMDLEDMKEDDPAGQQRISKQALALGQLHRYQRDIADQAQRVSLAITTIAEALNTGSTLSPPMIDHLKAQLLKAHLQFDDLLEVLEPIDHRRGPGEVDGPSHVRPSPSLWLWNLMGKFLLAWEGSEHQAL